MNYEDKADSKRQAKDALKAIREAERFLEEITRFGAEIQITRKEFDGLVAETRAIAKELLGWRALAMALLDDQPVPIRVFRSWASSATIWKWRNANEEPLPWEELNGKVCVKVSDFFKALRKHGKAKP